MTDISTPKTSSALLDSGADTQEEPRQSTLDFIRQFARCYMPAPISTGAVVVLN